VVYLPLESRVVFMDEGRCSMASLGSWIGFLAVGLVVGGLSGASIIEPKNRSEDFLSGVVEAFEDAD